MVADAFFVAPTTLHTVPVAPIVAICPSPRFLTLTEK